MVMVAKLSLSSSIMAANRAALYAHVPTQQTREQFLEAERERKQKYRDRMKRKRERLMGEKPQPEIADDIELNIEIIRD